IVSLGLTVARAEQHRSARTSQGQTSWDKAKARPSVQGDSAARLQLRNEGPEAPVVAGRRPRWWRAGGPGGGGPEAPVVAGRRPRWWRAGGPGGGGPEAPGGAGRRPPRGRLGSGAG